MEIRSAEPADVDALMALAADVIGPARAGPFVRSHLEGVRETLDALRQTLLQRRKNTL